MNPADVAYRCARPDDFDKLATLRWALKSEDETFVDGGFDAFRQYFVSAAADGAADGSQVHWVAEYRSDLIAAMSVVIVHKLPSPNKLRGKWGYLTNCFTTPAARGCGVGGGLLNAIKKWAQEENLEMLVVWPSKRAFSFYERAGFERAKDPLVIEFE